MDYHAYLFDVQGTLLDFFSPVRAAVEMYLHDVGAPLDRAAELTRWWRANYFQRCYQLPQSTDQWNPVQDEYTNGFIDLCVHHDLPVPDQHTAASVASSWLELVPWPDTRDGVARVSSRAIVATLSNTDMQTIVRLFKRLDIRWDAVLSAEVFGRFKPDPVVYQRALRFLGIEPHRAAMVASHPYDLRAAAALGLGTVFVSRPLEYGSVQLAHQDTAGEFTQRVTSINDIT